MEEELKEQPVDAQPIKSKRDAFMERMRGRYSDLKPEDEDGLYDKMGSDFDNFDKSQEAQKQLGELLSKDPRSAGFLMVMRKGGNPLEYLISEYGDDFREALNDEGKAKEFAAASAKYMEKQAKSAELSAMAEKNLQDMIDGLDSAQKEGKFSDEDARKAYDYLYGDGGLLDRIITNAVTKDDWSMLMKAASYDNMMSENQAKIEEAKQEGEINGRNANIDVMKKKQTKVEGMPTTLASAGGRPETKKAKNGTLDALDKMTNKSVWNK